jgi:hypothetical protein
VILLLRSRFYYKTRPQEKERECVSTLLSATYHPYWQLLSPLLVDLVSAPVLAEAVDAEGRVVADSATVAAAVVAVVVAWQHSSLRKSHRMSLPPVPQMREHTNQRSLALLLQVQENSE